MEKRPIVARRLWPWFAAGLVVLLAVGGCTVWWAIAVNTVDQGIVRWISDQRKSGITVDTTGIHYAGWPLKVRVSAEAPRIVGANFRWEGDAITAEAPVWDFSTIAVKLAGHQKVTAATVSIESPQGGQGTVRTQAANGHLLVDGDVGAISLSRDGVTMGRAGRIKVTVDALMAAAVGHETTAATLTVAGEAIRPTMPLPAPFAEGAQSVDLSLRLQGKPPSFDRDGWAAWSRDGGTIEVDRMRVDCGAVGAEVNGTLTLDNRLQPLIATTATIRGAATAVAALGDVIGPRNLMTAQTVVAMLSKPGPDGGEPVLRVPISVQDQSLYIGPARVARLAAMTW